MSSLPLPILLLIHLLSFGLFCVLGLGVKSVSLRNPFLRGLLVLGLLKCFSIAKLLFISFLLLVEQFHLVFRLMLVYVILPSILRLLTKLAATFLLQSI